MTIFSLDDDIRKFLLRATASLERVDGAVADVQRLARNADAAITELRATIASVNAGLTAMHPTKESST